MMPFRAYAAFLQSDECDAFPVTDGESKERWALQATIKAALSGVLQHCETAEDLDRAIKLTETRFRAGHYTPERVLTVKDRVLDNVLRYSDPNCYLFLGFSLN